MKTITVCINILYLIKQYSNADIAYLELLNIINVYLIVFLLIGVLILFARVWIVGKSVNNRITKLEVSTQRMENVLYNDIEKILLDEAYKVVKSNLMSKSKAAKGIQEYFKKQAGNLTHEFKRFKTGLFTSDSLDMLYDSAFRTNVIPKAEPVLRDCYTFTINDIPYTYPEYFIDEVDKINDKNYNKFQNKVRSAVIFKGSLSGNLTTSSVILQVKHLTISIFTEGVVEICNLYNRYKKDIEEREEALKQLAHDGLSSGIHNVVIGKTHLVELLERGNVDTLVSYLLKLAEEKGETTYKQLILNAKMNYNKLKEDAILTNNVPDNIDRFGSPSDYIPYFTNN